MTENKKLTPLVNLKALRLQAGKTLKELSESTGISYSALSAYERGTRKSKHWQIFLMCQLTTSKVSLKTPTQ